MIVYLGAVVSDGQARSSEHFSAMGYRIKEDDRVAKACESFRVKVPVYLGRLECRSDAIGVLGLFAGDAEEPYLVVC